MNRWTSRFYWWWMRRTSVYARAGGIPLIFLSAAASRGPDDVKALVEGAVVLLDETSRELADQVRAELTFVAAVNLGHSHTMVDARGLLSSFLDGETASSALFASQLVWASEFIRQIREQRERGEPGDRIIARSVAENVRRSFLALVPDGTKWIDRLEPIQE